MTELDDLRMACKRWEARVMTLERRARSAVDALQVGAVCFAGVVQDQIDWSRETFGDGDRTPGTLAHIRKELDEIAADPSDLEEWADVLILAMDGAWRATGANATAIVAAVVRKQIKNRMREWPAPGSVPVDQPVEHVRGRDE